MKTKYFNSEEKPLFFTSDTHLNHAAIINHCDRPFDDVEKMDQAIINNWNDKVPEDAIVIHSGDFCFGGKAHWRRYIEQLNGFILMIPGNHDKSIIAPIEGKFDIHEGYMNAKIRDEEFDEDTQYITICHYPMLSWYQSHRGSWNLHGHVHTGPRSTSKEAGLPYRLSQMDIGVDANDFTPLSWEEVKLIITGKMMKGKGVS